MGLSCAGLALDKRNPAGSQIMLRWNLLHMAEKEVRRNAPLQLVLCVPWSLSCEHRAQGTALVWLSLIVPKHQAQVPPDTSRKGSAPCWCWKQTLIG